MPMEVLALVKDVAHNRNAYEDVHGHGVKNPNIQDDPDKSYRTHHVGAMAEAAVCMYLGVDPVEHLTWETSGKGGRYGDLEIRGKSIEVKATEREGSSRLIVPKGRLQEADYYFLVYVDLRGLFCDVLGWATWEEVLDKNEPEERKPQMLQDKNLYTVKEKDLHTVGRGR